MSCLGFRRGCDNWSRSQTNEQPAAAFQQDENCRQFVHGPESVYQDIVSTSDRVTERTGEERVGRLGSQSGSFMFVDAVEKPPGPGRALVVEVVSLVLHNRLSGNSERPFEHSSTLVSTDPRESPNKLVSGNANQFVLFTSRVNKDLLIRLPATSFPRALPRAGATDPSK